MRQASKKHDTEDTEDARRSSTSGLIAPCTVYVFFQGFRYGSRRKAAATRPWCTGAEWWSEPVTEW
ncbi:MAG TPA: hypothetical protein VFV33_27270, partial [Gemmatimonadaceae bacterium]|nr:hypothetical protein [Gemmatimonadaceae bacterium]